MSRDESTLHYLRNGRSKHRNKDRKEIQRVRLCGGSRWIFKRIRAYLRHKKENICFVEGHRCCLSAKVRTEQVLLRTTMLFLVHYKVFLCCSGVHISHKSTSSRSRRVLPEQYDGCAPTAFTQVDYCLNRWMRELMDSGNFTSGWKRLVMVHKSFADVFIDLGGFLQCCKDSRD